jgi:hypothetical protein
VSTSITSSNGAKTNDVLERTRVELRTDEGIQRAILDELIHIRKQLELMTDEPSEDEPEPI